MHQRKFIFTYLLFALLISCTFSNDTASKSCVFSNDAASKFKKHNIDFHLNDLTETVNLGDIKKRFYLQISQKQSHILGEKLKNLLTLY